MTSPVFIAQDLRHATTALAALNRPEFQQAQMHLAVGLVLLQAAIRPARPRVLDHAPQAMAA